MLSSKFIKKKKSLQFTALTWLNAFCGDQLPLEVLFRLDKLGLWSNDPIRGHGHVRGRSTKIEMEVALQEELKGIYSRPKPNQGEQSPRNIWSRWLEASQSP